MVGGAKMTGQQPFLFAVLGHQHGHEILHLRIGGDGLKTQQRELDIDVRKQPGIRVHAASISR